MYTKKEVGKIGEDISSKYLKNSNYEIINRNFFSKYGEIDIIAKDIKRNEVVFIEVKTRTNKKIWRTIRSNRSNKIKTYI